MLKKSFKNITKNKKNRENRKTCVQYVTIIVLSPFVCKHADINSVNHALKITFFLRSLTTLFLSVALNAMNFWLFLISKEPTTIKKFRKSLPGIMLSVYCSQTNNYMLAVFPIIASKFFKFLKITLKIRFHATNVWCSFAFYVIKILILV